MWYRNWKFEKQLKRVLRLWWNDPRYALSENAEQRIRERVFREVYRAKNKQEAPVSLYIRVHTLAKLFIPQNVWRFALQPALVMVIVLGVGTGGWITSVQAASKSLPGDALYSIKIASEKTQVAFASLSHDERAVTGLRMVFASRRLDEVKKVSRVKNQKEKEARASVAVRGFKEQITNLNTSLNDLKTTQPESLVQVAKTVGEKRGAFVDALSQAKAGAGSPLVEHQLQEATQLVKQTSDAAVAVVVAHHASGNTEVSTKEVAAMVGDQLNRARDTVDALVKQEGVGNAARRQVAQVVRDAEQLIEKQEFDGALTRVRAIQEIADTVAPAPGDGAPSFAATITRVIENVTSTIIGEKR